MRCPKCGYNSFDHLDSCKKCGKDLAEHKARFNIQSILLSEMPAEAMASVAEEAVAAAVAPEVTIDDFAGGETADTDIDDFGFDFMGDSEDEENLAFDELFEEVPAEDEVEEALEAPNMEPAASGPEEPAEEPIPLDEELASYEEKSAADPAAEFSFDESEDDADAFEEPADVSSEAADFGFDTEDDPDADIFAETEEDFSLDAFDTDETEKS